MRALHLALGFVAASMAAPVAAAQGEISLEFERRPLPEIVAEIGRQTGLSLIYDDQLAGNLTLSVPFLASRDEAVAILETALLIAGFAALPVESGVRRILPIAEATANAPWIGDGDLSDSDGPVATLLRLESADAETVSAKLAHLVSKQDAVVPYPPTNSLILVGSERRLGRLIGLAQLIDRGTNIEIAIHALRHRDAREVLELVTQSFAAKPGFDVWADERTNRLIARGGEEPLVELAEFISRIDRPSVTQGALEVLPLLHRGPAEIAELLSALAQGQAQGPGQRATASGETLMDREFIVVPEPHTGSLLVQADPETRGIVRDIVRELDRPARRVLVEISVVEVSKPSTLAFGFDFFLPLREVTSASDAVVTMFSNPSGGGIRSMPGPDLTFFGRIAREPLVLSVVDPETGIPLSVLVPREQAAISAIDRKLVTEIRARPSLLLLEGEEHELFVGDNIPIPVSQGSGAVAGVAGLTTSQTIERYDSGLTMRVRPTLGGAGDVLLETHFEITSVVASITGDVAQVGPTLSQRGIDATVRLRDGEIAVLGMGQDQLEEITLSGTPFLRDIPFFGFFFRAQRREVRDRQILVTLEAHVLEDRIDSQKETLRLQLGYAREKARAPGITLPDGHQYALRVGGARSEREARLLTRELAEVGFTPQITAWSWDGEPQYDVYLGSYESIVELGRAQRRARAAGHRAELVLGGDAARAGAGSAGGGSLGEAMAAGLGFARP